MRLHAPVVSLVFLAGVPFASADVLCLPDSPCARENARRIALVSINTRYKPCMDVYPNLDVVSAVRERKPIDPVSAKECMLGVAGVSARYFVPAVDAASKLVTLKELTDPVAVLGSELDFRDAIRRERSAAVATFAQQTARHFDDRFKGASVVPDGVIVVKTIPIRPFAPVGPQVRAEIPYAGFAEIPPQQRGPYRVVKGADLFQRILNALGGELKVDGKPGPATRDAVTDFQTRHGLARKDGVIDAETASAVIRELQRRYPGAEKLEASGVWDASAESALKRAEASRLRAVDLSNGRRTFTVEGVGDDPMPPFSGYPADEVNGVVIPHQGWKGLRMGDLVKLTLVDRKTNAKIKSVWARVWDTHGGRNAVSEFSTRLAGDLEGMAVPALRKASSVSGTYHVPAAARLTITGYPGSQSILDGGKKFIGRERVRQPDLPSHEVRDNTAAFIGRVE